MKKILSLIVFLFIFLSVQAANEEVPIYLKCTMSESTTTLTNRYVTYYKLVGQDLYDNDNIKLDTTVTDDEIIASYRKDESSDLYSYFRFEFNRKSGGYKRIHSVFEKKRNKFYGRKEMFGYCVKDDGSNFNKRAF